MVTSVVTSKTAGSKGDGWVRHLGDKVQAKADAMVMQAMVTGKVSPETKADDLVTRQAVTGDVTAERAVSERQIIEANADAMVDRQSVDSKVDRAVGHRGATLPGGKHRDITP